METVMERETEMEMEMANFRALRAPKAPKALKALKEMEMETLVETF